MSGIALYYVIIFCVLDDVYDEREFHVEFQMYAPPPRLDTLNI